MKGKPVKGLVTKDEAEGGLLPAFLLLGLWAAFLLSTDTQLLDLKRAWGSALIAVALLWLAWRAWKGQATLRPPRALALALSALGVAYAVAWMASPYASAGIYRVELLMLGSVLALVVACLPESVIERWPWVTLACAALIAVYALLQRLGLDPVEAYRLVGSQDRATGPFGNATFLAAFLCFAWPLVLLWHDTRRSAMLLLLVLALLATQSRAGVLALSAQLVLLGVEAWREGLRPRMAPLVTAGVLAGLAGLWLFPEAQWVRATLRPQLWVESLKLSLQRPWLGWGPGTFPIVLQEHGSAAWKAALGGSQFAEHPHDWLLGIWHEAGALGLVAWAGLLAVVQPWPVDRARRDPVQRVVALGLFGLLVQNLFDRNLDQAALGLGFFFGVGILCRDGSAKPWVWPRWSAGLLLAWALGAAVLAWRPVGAYQASVGPVSLQQDGVAMEDLQRAVFQAPRDAGAHERLAAAFAARGAFEDALRSYQRAYELQATPGRAQNMGNCLMELGRADQAEGRYRLALLVGPPTADLHFSLGYALYKQNKLKEALAALDAALKLEPRHAAASKLKEQMLR